MPRTDFVHLEMKGMRTRHYTYYENCHCPVSPYRKLIIGVSFCRELFALPIDAFRVEVTLIPDVLFSTKDGLNLIFKPSKDLLITFDVQV